MRISVLGTGYVGLMVGAGFSETGNSVKCVDVDISKIDSLRNGIIPIYEPGLEKLVFDNIKSGRLTFSNEVDEAIQWSEVVFIAVGTPEKEDGRADLTSIFQAAHTIGNNMNGYKIVVCKSTVPVGTNEIIYNTIKKLTENPFVVVSNPEFLKEGDAVNDFMKPDRVIIGTNDENARKVMHRLYLPLQRTKERIIFMDPRSAELTKYVSNAYLATRISFINEMARLCDLFGADISAVRIGAGSDSRIGLKYFYPGCGYGGSCFPKDVQALINMARDAKSKSDILETVDRLNEIHKLVPFEKLKKHFRGDLNGKKVALWGLSFKPETDDIREAPSIAIATALLAEGASVHAFDPAANENFKRIFGDNIVYHNDPYETTEGANALILVTEWKQFRSPDFERLKKTMKTPVIIDGRNIFAGYGIEGIGFIYYGIGQGGIIS